MKKEIPILMSTLMVQAILAGRKTITRREIKWPNVPDWHDCDYEANSVVRPKDGLWWPHFNHKGFDGKVLQDIEGIVKCPYGKPGDILYVREEHYHWGKWEQKGLTKTGRQKWEFFAEGSNVLFADSAPATQHKSREAFLRSCKEYGEPDWKPSWFKRNARFLPKKYSRIWLEITDIRVERLKAISIGDAIDEGVEYWNVDQEAFKGTEMLADYKNYMWRDDPTYPEYHHPSFPNPIDSFRTLWQSINGADSWKANPWVWVVKFKVLSKTGKPAVLEKQVAR